jgi:hypothetical protein
MFTSAVPVRGGEVVERDGFVFADLLPENGTDHRGGAEVGEDGRKTRSTARPGSAEPRP